MKKNWTNLPDNYFVGKFVKYGFPYYSERYRKNLLEFAWLKVEGILDGYLVCVLDSDLRTNPKYLAGTVTHVLKNDIEDVMGSGQ